MQTMFVLLESGGRQLISTRLQWCWYLRHAIAGEVAQHEQSQHSGRLPLRRPGELLHCEAGAGHRADNEPGTKNLGALGDGFVASPVVRAGVSPAC
jgi:hypothetical protein